MTTFMLRQHLCYSRDPNRLRDTVYFPNGNDIILDYSLLIKKVALLINFWKKFPWLRQFDTLRLFSTLYIGDNKQDNKIMGLLMSVPLEGRRTLKRERHLYCQKNKHLSIYFVIILLHVWVTLSVPYAFFFLCTHLFFHFHFASV